MEHIDTERAPRAILHVADATEWLTAVEAVNSGSLEFLDERHDAPSAADLTFTSDWRISDYADENDFFEQATSILRTAIELGHLELPQGIYVHLNDRGEDWYDWSVTCERYGSIMLAGLARPMTSLGSPDREGAQRAMTILQEAVSETNQMLANLLSGSLTLLAETTTDPAILTRLAGYADPGIRATVLGNPATPDEGRVLAALQDMG